MTGTVFVAWLRREDRNAWERLGVFASATAAAALVADAPHGTHARVRVTDHLVTTESAAPELPEFAPEDFFTQLARTGNRVRPPTR